MSQPEEFLQVSTQESRACELIVKGLRKVARVLDYRFDQFGDHSRDVVRARVFLMRLGWSSNEHTNSEERLIYNEALALILAGLKTRHRIRCLKPWAVNAYCPTENNIRELAFFEQLSRRGDCDWQVHNVAGAIGFENDAAVAVDNEIAYAIENAAIHWLIERREINPLTLAEAIKLLNSLAGLISSTPRSLWDTIPFAVIANDHSPTQVAFSVAAQMRQVPVVYLQHAEISSIFPPLDFDVSVLQNDRSRELYEEIGKPRGSVHVISRWKSTIDFKKLTHPRQNPRVTIYLTSVPIYSKTLELVQKLSRNPHIRDLRVKPHPRAPQELKDSIAEWPCVMVDDLSVDTDVAIVQNSSVVVELLHLGIQVWQIFGTDEISRDYYGFVDYGLVSELGWNSLEGRFWHQVEFDEEWLGRMSKYDPSVYGSRKDNEMTLLRELREIADRRLGEYQLGAAIKSERLPVPIQCTPSGVSPRGSAFARCLLAAPAATLSSLDFVWDGVEESGRVEGKLSIDINTAIAVVEVLHANRIPGVFKLFRCALEQPLKTDFHAWLGLMSVLWNKQEVDTYWNERVIQYVKKSKAACETRTKLECLLLMHLIRSDDQTAIEEFFGWSYALQIHNLPVEQRIALLQVFSGRNDTTAGMEYLLSRLRDGVTGYNLLKLDCLGQRFPSSRSFKGDHRYWERRFAREAPEQARQEFVGEILPLYCKYREKMNYMDVRQSAVERRQLVYMLERSLLNGMGYSFIRVSDGEGYLFSGDEGIFTLDDARNRERHWWGVELEDEIRREIQKINREGALKADILGIPSVYRMIRDTTLRSKGLSNSITGRGLVQVARGVMQSAGEFGELTEEKANVSVFHNSETIKRLASAAANVVVISSVEQDLVKTLLAQNNVECIGISTHARTMGQAKYTSTLDVLPYNYQRVLDELQVKVGPGVLVIVAAGVAGKVFVHRAKELGGVGVDIGGSIDMWVSGSQLPI